MDYSGFDREKWVLRSGSDHKRKCLNILDTATQSERNSLESSSGCRYSVLVCLPYFDSPRMLVVDPMHNLFLGSAKHYMKGIFINRGILSDENFKYFQTCINSFHVPADIGRIPHKISKSFASFTADQWKNWTIYFSMIVLRDIVSSDILECWCHFVLACSYPSYSCRRMLNPTEKSHLIELYSDLHKVSRSTIEISSVCIKYLHITMHGKQLGSHNSRMAS